MGNGESVVYMYPSNIRFTHDSIQSNFSDGHSIPETFRQILWKKLTVEDLPLIEVMKYGGEWFVVRGNRRLFLFQELEKRGLVSQVKVQTRNFDQYLFQTQHTTSNKGKTILIRGYGHHAVKQELDEIWSEYQRETCKFNCFTNIQIDTCSICTLYYEINVDCIDEFDLIAHPKIYKISK